MCGWVPNLYYLDGTQDRKKDIDHLNVKFVFDYGLLFYPGQCAQERNGFDPQSILKIFVSSNDKAHFNDGFDMGHNNGNLRFEKVIVNLKEQSELVISVWKADN